jgi:hypothetical protein
MVAACQEALCTDKVAHDFFSRFVRFNEGYQLQEMGAMDITICEQKRAKASIEM